MHDIIHYGTPELRKLKYLDGGDNWAIMKVKNLIIASVRAVASNLPGWLMPRRFKYVAEYLFWRSRKALEGDLANTHYEKLMLQMGQLRLPP